MYLRIPSVLYTQQGYAIYGPDNAIDPEQVLGVEAKVHHWHAHRPDQHLSIVHLSTGAKVEIFMRSERFTRAVEEAMERLHREKAADNAAPEMLAITRRALELGCIRLAGMLAQGENADELMAELLKLADQKENLAALQLAR
jgi:hypothetical protein